MEEESLRQVWLWHRKQFGEPTPGERQQATPGDIEKSCRDRTLIQPSD
jgi:hypothetical protein